MGELNMLNMDQTQRRDIDTTLDDRLTLAIDEENIADNPYIFEPSSFVGNNWFKQGNNIVKLNLVEQDSLIFLSSPLTKLLQKDITNVIVSFDYNISNVSVNYPILSNISLTCMEMTNYMLVENILTTQGHIDVDCSLFNFSSNVVNTSISEQGFKIGINFNGNKSNATIKLSNVQIQFKYQNKLSTQEDSVVNRLEPHIDFYRDEDGDLVLQIGGDATGKGMDHSGGDIDTYSKTEIDNKLATKVNVEIGKGLSSNDYTLTEKTKLASVETNANYYVHPSSHQTGMITEASALTNLETSANATQHEINLAIDSKINSGGGSVDWSDIENKPSDYPPSTHTHTVSDVTDFPTLSTVATTGDYDDLLDKPSIPSSSSDLSDGSDLVKKSSTSGLLKNDGSVDTNSYLTSSSLSNYVQKSSTSGLLKNDGTVDTNAYITSSAISGKEDTSNKVSSWSSTTNDTHYPTEKLVKDSLDTKQATLVSGANIKTVNNQSLLGSGNIVIQGGGTGVDIATSWGNPTSDSKVPSEKLAKDTLDGKANVSHTHTKSEITDFPSIPSKTSDLQNDGDGSNVFVKDNDSRLSNARTPLAHTHLSSDVTDLIDVIYPVGSIYMSVNSVNPSTLFGGTWEQIEDTFLLASGTNYANGTTGGSADSVVVSHNHKATANNFLESNTALTRGGQRAYTPPNSDGIYYIYSNNSNTNTTLNIHNTTQNSGVSGTGKNMPPYFVVNVWKRTA